MKKQETESKRYKVSVIVPVYNQQKLITRALNSIPNRDDIQIIVINDGSEDKTSHAVYKWWKEEGNKARNVTFVNKDHEGVGAAVNQGYDLAEGEYVVLLGSDDYFFTDKFEGIMAYLDGTDLVYFNAEVNNGDIWDLNEESADWMCGSYRFTKMSLIGEDRCENWKYGEDRSLWNKIKIKPHTTKYTHICIKHYNHPREGSVTDKHNKGEF